MTLKCDGWPWKTIGHLFYTTSSFVHRFKAMGQFKLELQSGNAQFSSKSAIFCPPWPCNLTLKNNRTPLLYYVKLCVSFQSHEWIQTGVTVWKTTNSAQNQWCLVPCDLEIWWTTLKNNRAHLLCYFKLCASFHGHFWIQTGVIVWKRPIWVKIDDCFSHVTLKFDGWPWKTIGHLS